MPWLALTSADVDDYLVAAKATALRTAALGAGQTDTIPRVLADVTAYVRLAVAGCARNILDADTAKIPASLKTQALDIVIQRLHLRLDQQLKEDRVRAYEQAERILGLVRDCKQPIEETLSPEADPAAQQAGGIEQAIAIPTRKATASRLDGL
ncbi:MAG: hypothetical protein HY360_07670 [Verrucomicrobia bacterium]|nr:hypothetical protein [Verrucomicrobiota bacterium]